jgi:hypothetical protein
MRRFSIPQQLAALAAPVDLRPDFPLRPPVWNRHWRWPPDLLEFQKDFLKDSERRKRLMYGEWRTPNTATPIRDFRAVRQHAASRYGPSACNHMPYGKTMRALMQAYIYAKLSGKPVIVVSPRNDGDMVIHPDGHTEPYTRGTGGELVLLLPAEQGT